MRNRYYRRSKLSAAVFREILKYFCLDLSASDAARLSGVSIRSVNDIYLKLRERLAEECERELHGRGPDERETPEHADVGAEAQSAIVFGLRRRAGGVHAEVVPQPWPSALVPLIRGKGGAEAVAELDRWRGYTCLVDVASEKLLRLDFAEGAPTYERRQLDDMEGFWSYAKRRLSKFNGVPAHTFHLHLKECEYRFNRTGEDLYAGLLKLLRDLPL